MASISGTKPCWEPHWIELARAQGALSVVQHLELLPRRLLPQLLTPRISSWDEKGRGI